MNMHTKTRFSMHVRADMHTKARFSMHVRMEAER